MFLKFLENKELSKLNIALFIKKISKSHKPRSVRCVFKIIRQYVKFNKCDFLDELYEMRLPSFEEEPRIIIRKKDYDELQNLFNLKKWINKRDSLLLEIMFKTGLRSDEILNLRKSSIHGNKIYVLGKSNKTRYVLLLDDLKIKMLNWDFEYFTVNKNGKKLAKRTFYIIIRNLGNKINLKISPHSLRRSFCSNLIKNGCNIKVVQKMMGHSSISTTSKYIFYDEQEMLEELKKVLKSRKLSVYSK